MIKAVDIDGSDSRRCDEIFVRRLFSLDGNEIKTH